MDGQKIPLGDYFVHDRDGTHKIVRLTATTQVEYPGELFAVSTDSEGCKTIVAKPALVQAGPNGCSVMPCSWNGVVTITGENADDPLFKAEIVRQIDEGVAKVNVLLDKTPSGQTWHDRPSLL